MEETASDVNGAIIQLEMAMESLARQLQMFAELEVAHYWSEVARTVEQNKEYAKYVPLIVRGRYSVRILWGMNTLVERPVKGRKAKTEIRKLDGGERNYVLREFAESKPWELALIKQTEERFRDLRKVSQLLKTMKDQKLALQNRMLQIESWPTLGQLDMHD